MPPHARAASDPPTLSKVAAAAGVSTAAVSYVLNGQPGVAEATRERVLTAAARLGYRPNQLAQALRRGRTRLLGLLLPDLANPFYPEFAAGVISAAADAGYQVFVGHSGLDNELQESEVEALREQRCAGLILTSVVDRDRPLLDDLIASRIAVVQVIRRVAGVAADFVGTNEEEGGLAAMRHVLDLGHTDVGILAGPETSSASRARLAGYRRALAERNQELGRSRLCYGTLTYDSGYEGAQTIVAARRRPPTALICGNDVMALGAIDALADAGYRVPEDVALVGYDDMSFAALRPISLTTIHQPRRRIGREAVRALLDRIEHPEAPLKEIVLPQRLVVRRSCGSACANERGST